MLFTPQPPVDIRRSWKSARTSKIRNSFTLSGSSKTTVEQWIQGLPLAKALTELFPKDISEVANLTSHQITDIIKLHCSNLETTIAEGCSRLKDALEVEANNQNNNKFTFLGGFGSIEDFYKSIYDRIGHPNTNWEEGIRIEHKNCTDMFETSNHHIKTNAQTEWLHVVDGVPPPVESMGHGRVIKAIEDYLSLATAKEAGLTRAEVIALVLYTGPMYMVLNTILRKYPSDQYEDLKAKDNLFPTTIFVLMSALQKLAAVMVLNPDRCMVYRGVDGNMDLPESFYEPDSHGCFGMMEPAFTSTTSDLKMAISYTGIERGGKAHPTVFKVVMDSVDRAADISEFSQYPGEKEFLWAPGAFMQPIREEIIATQWGLVRIIQVKLNANIKVDRIEVYESRKKDLHMTSIKLQMQDLQTRLNEMSSPAKDSETTKRFVDKCMEECLAVKYEHDQLAAAEYNNDAVYRGLVTKLLDSKKFAITKMEYLLLCHKDAEEWFLPKPMRMCFRDHMGGLVLKLKASLDTAEAIRLCKLFGLISQNVSERNELNEPPLIKAIADGVTDDKLELLLLAGSDVNEITDYPGRLRKGMTPMLTASLYGRTSMVSILVEGGGHITAADGEGKSCVYYAAKNGHAPVVEALVGLGADVNRPKNNDVTPLYRAAKDGHIQVVEALAKLGADVNKPKKNGATPLHKASENGHIQVVEVLAKLGADVNKADNYGATPLYIAAQFGHASLVHVLLCLGADPSIARQGSTPMKVAVQKKYNAVIKVLKAYDEDEDDIMQDA